MVRIGIAGIGFMGMIHFLAWRRLQGAAVSAIQSRDPGKRAGDWRAIHGNFGPRGQMVDLAGVKTYADLAEMLADPEVDLVDVCLPTHLHAPAALQALRAGKHVLVEKPIALTAADADAMLAGAASARRLLMVAQVLPFFPEFAFALDFLRTGRGGRVLAAHLDRIISRPDWSADIADPEKTGGPAIDLHIHDAHFVAAAFGVPERVFSRGVVAGSVVQHLTTHYLYDAGPACISSTGGALCQKGRPFVHGFEIYLEKASLLHRSGTQPLTVLHADGRCEQPLADAGSDPIDAFARELQAAADAVASGAPPPLLDARLARDALVMCRKECESVFSGRAVDVKAG